MELVFATSNENKAKEIQNLMPSFVTVLSLNDIHCKEEIPETQPTIEGNASQKARYIFEKYKKNCFADDTGLEIEALNNRPGVFSARYAGETKDANANMEKVLIEMKGIANRNARFKTVISIIVDGKEMLFEGIVNGTILNEKRGNKGFGYDPIFVPNGFDESFAQMELIKKNKISHRAIAVSKLVDFLKHIKP